MQFPTVARSAIEVIERGDPLKALCSGTVVSVRLFTRPESSWNPEEKGHFYTLFSLLDQLRHPNIVSCVGFLHDPTTGYQGLITEYVSHSLPQFLGSRQTPDWKLHERVSLCSDIYTGLSWLELKKLPPPASITSVQVCYAGNEAVCKIDMAQVLLAGFLLPPLPPRPALAFNNDRRKTINALVVLFCEVFYYPRLFDGTLSGRSVKELWSGAVQGWPALDPVLIRFLEEIWSGRKDFDEPPNETITDSMHKVILELYYNVYALLYGSWFWQNSFPHKTKTTFEEFYQRLSVFFPEVSRLKDDLKDYLTQGDDVVTVEAYRNFLLWFGDGREALTELEALKACSWFVGKTEREEAEKRLMAAERDCFLVRLNLGGSKPIPEAPYIVSYKKANTYIHSRIELVGERTSPTGEYRFNDETGRTHTSKKVPLSIFVPQLAGASDIGVPLPRLLGRSLRIYL